MNLKQEDVKFLKNRIMTTYSINEEDSQTILSILDADAQVFKEFQHFLTTNEFVPEKKCVSYYGYSVKDIVRATGVNPVAAFVFAASLKENPMDILPLLI